MHDFKALRTDPKAFDYDLARRGLPPASKLLLEYDEERRQYLNELHQKQADRNNLSKQISELKRNRLNTTELEERGINLRQALETLQAKVNELELKIFNILASLPNRLAQDVPQGADESGNKVVHQWGNPNIFDFVPRQHFELGEKLGMMDFAIASKMSGARFCILQGDLARLERALGQFMLDFHVAEHGYTEYVVPLLVNEQTMYNTDKLPKFGDQSFCTKDERWLIPTAEVPLTAMQADELIQENCLPIRRTALSACFRSEAGAAGKDTRGLIRQHQFYKVEMVSVTTPEQSEIEHERMTRCAEEVLEKLNLSYRRVLLCSGDTGFGAAKTWDLEVWLPGQQAWREISSCSNTRSFQARRMNARYRPDSSEGKKAGPEFVHTLNGSGVAVGRALVAVMENYQNQDGSITVPELLRQYMGNLQKIG
ncbi:Serine--tRNA ligase [Commensalibacter sp. Nvir]|uniref:serine--tRNA ligase n=1 Tax=Commensalibacter sp. Nvir TaxID=3069817 RepID=UPI002D6E654B|nr:Serine--tRNA ligase [Commensalibacter sp. Nvir]